jgi:hypothetical protein
VKNPISGIAYPEKLNITQVNAPAFIQSASTTGLAFRVSEGHIYHVSDLRRAAYAAHIDKSLRRSRWAAALLRQ